MHMQCETELMACRELGLQNQTGKECTLPVSVVELFVACIIRSKDMRAASMPSSSSVPKALTMPGRNLLAMSR